MSRRDPKRRPVRVGSIRLDIILLGLLAIVTLVAFQPAIHCDFNLIDELVVTHQPHVNTGLSAANLRWALTTSELGYPIPVTLISYMADTEMFGPSPKAFHAENVAWHVANVLLLYLLLRRLTGSAWRSAAVSALFAVHPLRAESVAWVTERKDVLAAFFGILAMHAYVAYARRPPGRSRLASLHEPQLSGSGFSTNQSLTLAARSNADALRRPRIILYLLIMPLLALSLFAKPMLVMLPLLLLAIDYWPLRRIGVSVSIRRAALEKAPLAIVAIFCTLAGMWGQAASQPARHLRAMQFSSGQLAANALVSYMRYIGKVFWFPHLGLAYPLVPHWPAWVVAGAVLCLLAMTLLACWQARARPWLAVGWLWYAILLLPAAGFYVLGDFSIADRYTYFPSIGLLIMLIWSVRKRFIRPAAVAFAVALVGLVAATRAQVYTWHDNLTLYQHAISAVGPNDTTCAGLGDALARENRIPEAITCLKQAIAINPGNVDAHATLAIALDRQGDYPAAVPHYIIAVAAMPKDPQYDYNLGTDLVALGRPAEALPYLRHAIEISPATFEFHANLANALLTSGDYNAAIDECRPLLKRNPKATGVRDTLAAALAASGRVAEAKAEYGVAILNDRQSSRTYNELGALYLANHWNTAMAESCFKNALRLDPRLTTAHNNLGLALAQEGKMNEAAAEFKAALAIDPANADARRYLKMAGGTPDTQP